MHYLTEDERQHRHEARRLAVEGDWSAERGNHHDAARRYQAAADAYRRGGHSVLAGTCERLAAAERDLARPTFPVNTSALVD